MATPAVNRSEIEKIVRKVLDEERPDGAAALKAIKRVSSLLTEEVIPNLPEKGHEGDDTGSGNGDDADSDSAPRLVHSVSDRRRPRTTKIHQTTIPAPMPATKPPRCRTV